MPKYLARVLGLLLPLLLLSGCGNLNEDLNAPPTEGSQDEQTLASRRSKYPPAKPGALVCEPLKAA